MLNQIQPFDDRRDLFIAQSEKEAVEFAVEHWVHSAERAIQQRGRFAVALSGGKTPKIIYEKVTKRKLDWSQVLLFWSDERAVPPDHPESNYKMAMEAGFQNVVSPGQIFRMKAEGEIKKAAADYEDLIQRELGSHLFDLVMLGVGEDGHTASLFPNTEALQAKTLVTPNYVPEKKSWRLSLTFPCINQSRNMAIYALGAAKQQIVSKVLNAAIVSPYPASQVGTHEHKALWVLDTPLI